MEQDNNIPENCSIYLKREIFLKNILFQTISKTSTQKALKTLSKLTGEFFDADYCLIIQYDEKQDKVSCNISEYISSPKLRDIKDLDLNKYNIKFIKKTLFKENHLILTQNIEKSNLPADIKNLFKKYNIKSHMSAPLTYQNQIFGWISINSIKDNCYTKTDLDTLGVIASHSSFIFHKLKVEGQIKNQIKKEAALRKITTNCLNCDNFEDAIYSIVKDLAQLTNMNRGSFREYDENFKIFLDVAGDYCLTEKCLPEKHQRSFNSRFSAYMSKWVFKKTMTSIEDINILKNKTAEEKEHLARIKDLGLKSLHIISLKSYNKNLGFIMIGNTKDTGKLSQEQQELIIFVMPLIYSCIKLFILNRKISRQREAEIIANKLSTKIGDKDTISYFIKQLFYYFNVDNTLYLQYDKNENLIIKEYYLTERLYLNKDLQKDCANYLKTLIKDKSDILYINDTNQEITDIELREKLKLCHVKAFVSNCEHTFGKSKSTGIFALVSRTKRTWSYNEIKLFKYLIEFFINKQTEHIQKVELEETRQSFIATLTHDLKSPIVSCQKAVEAMLMMPEAILVQNMKEYLKDIYSSNEEILKLINSLLSVYHYESSEYKLNYEVFDFNKTIISATSILKHLLMDKNCSINLKLDENLPKITGDEGEIKRVLLNLLTNAIKHSEQNSEIVIKSQKENEYIKYSIKNFGENIQEEDLTSIFEKFKTSKRITGTGLGLYLSKQIIEAHKGSIGAKSIEEKGTTFYFKIPISKCSQ